ncbi:MAG: host attachment protein [Gammaproteobacteria bacterium]|nr:host attachment protein [Gammaproteobacteria bacterium]MDH4254083.1 host attachment protein [Gammaproteobacteria bacterium]MDH5310475.1 host attachment protein [Gammaproteobacteria bacterium]
MQANSVATTKHYWIVVADESAAVVYGQERKNGPLTSMFTLENSEGRRHTGELISDRGGRAFDSHGQGRHTMAREKTDPKRHLATIFAKEIAEKIGHAVHDGSCRGYALIAAPRFLGLLRDALATSVKEEPFLSVAKDVVDKDPKFIEGLLSGS